MTTVIRNSFKKKFNIVAAIVSNTNGIGLGGGLPWVKPIKEDMDFFKKITTETSGSGGKFNSVIMGRQTYESIPENYRPLKNRYNFVFSNRLNKDTENMSFVKSIDDIFMHKDINKIEKHFVIGGSQIYKHFLNPCYVDLVDKIYLTHVNKNYESDTFFPPVPKWFKLVKEETLSADLTLKTYQNVANISSDEQNYLNCLKYVLENGEHIVDRTKVGTFSVPHQTISFDIKTIDSVNQKDIIYYPPIMTTKSLFMKGVIWELIWFLTGNTNVKWLQERKVKIWDGNSSREFLDKVGLDYEEGMIGPGYGHQWVNWGGTTDAKGINQIQNIIDLLRNDPASRRAVLSAWNVSDVPKMALPPCHLMYLFKVSDHNTPGKKKLNCMVILRSNDLFLGCPFNIASASILTILISRALNMLPGKLTLAISDAHIYANHVEQVKEQLARIPLETPSMTINKEINGHESMTKLVYDDFTFGNYYSWPAIKAEMAI